MNELPDPSALTHDQQKFLYQQVRSEIERRVALDPARWFRWHEQQDLVFELPMRLREAGKECRLIVVLGGNGSGKSKVGGGLLSRIVRREHSLNAQFMTLDRITGEPRAKLPTDPLRIWVVPPSSEKLRQDILEPADGLGLKHWIGEELIASDFKWRGSGGEMITTYGDWIIGKTQEQDLAQFESSEVDVIWFDEEPLDEQQFNSCLMRLRTTHGVIIMTFTPLSGLSWSYDRIFKPLVIQQRAEQVAPRAWTHAPEKGRGVVIVQMGTRDNPLAKDYADEIEADPEMSDAEKGARLHGRYGYVEGALLPRLSGLDLESPVGWQEYFVVDRLPGMAYTEGGQRKVAPGRIAQWLLFSDPNKSFGSVLGALDQDDNLFMVDYHLEEGWADPLHVERLKEIMREMGLNEHTVVKRADYGGAGSHSMVNMAYHGLVFENVEKGEGSVARSIKKLRGRTHFYTDHEHPFLGRITGPDGKPVGAPKLYLYRPRLLKDRVDPQTGGATKHCALTEQLSMARQSANPRDPMDTPHKDVKHKLDLFDCARYMALFVATLAVPDGDEGQHEHHSLAWRREHLPTDDAKKDRRLGVWDQEWTVPNISWPT